MDRFNRVAVLLMMAVACCMAQAGFLSSAALPALGIATANADADIHGLGQTKDLTRTVLLYSEAYFGMFLPPAAGELIGDHEADGVAFCTSPSAVANYSSCYLFEEGFVLSTHFKSTAEYVQVTGRINGTIYTAPGDEGGQYDHNDSPVGGACYGYRFFVSLVEPAEGTYCIRCCRKRHHCPTGRSTEGCGNVIAGDYS